MEVSSHALELHRADGIEFDVRRLHEPDAGPPRLPRHARRLLRVEAAPVHSRVGRAARGRGRQRRRRVGRAARGRGHRGGTHARSRPSALERDADFRATDVALRRGRARRSSATRAARRSTCACRCPGCSTSTTRSPRSPRRTRSASRRTRPPRRSRRAQRVPGRFEPVDEGQAFGVLVDYAHTPDSLENVLRVRARPARPGRRGPADRRVRRRRRPRPRQAPADGRGGAAPRRPRRRDLRQPALRGPRRDHRRDRRGRGGGAPPATARRWRSSPTAAPRSSARWSSRGPATSW